MQLQFELWVAGAPGEGLKMRKKGPRDLWRRMLRDAAGVKDPQTPLCFGCKGIKAKGLIFSGSLLASSSWCFVN